MPYIETYDTYFKYNPDLSYAMTYFGNESLNLEGLKPPLKYMLLVVLQNMLSVSGLKILEKHVQIGCVCCKQHVDLT